ncbi:MAG: HlyC/CorC family transporter [Chloroflexi bacterium]|nr:HlyC/CorC family transporter [Chloroflexota bacterium]
MGAIGLELVLIVVLVLINGVLAGSELAVVSARKVRLQHRAASGDAGAQVALELASEPNRFLSTVQIGITLVGILAGAFGGATVAEKLAEQLEDAGLSDSVSAPAGVLLVVIGITYLSLIIGELVPKRLALAHPEAIAAIVARPMRVLAIAGTPVVAVLSISTEAVLRVLRLRAPSDVAVTEEELKVLLQQGVAAGVIEAAEHEMAAAIFRLGDRRVAHLMTPRLDAVWLDVADPVERALELMAASPHERYPVCENGPDNVLGVVAGKDLFALVARGELPDLRTVLRPALYVPETLSALAVLERFKQAPSTLAVVVDEYGGTNGILALTDVMEAIVGALPSDEVEEQAIVRRPDGSWLIDGRLPFDELAALLRLPRSPGRSDYQTLAGLVLHEMGHIPSVGDSVDWGEYHFEVVDMDARRIDRVLVTPGERSGGLQG